MQCDRFGLLLSMVFSFSGVELEKINIYVKIYERYKFVITKIFEVCSQLLPFIAFWQNLEPEWIYSYSICPIKTQNLQKCAIVKNLKFLLGNIHLKRNKIQIISCWHLFYSHFMTQNDGSLMITIIGVIIVTFQLPKTIHE